MTRILQFTALLVILAGCRIQTKPTVEAPSAEKPAEVRPIVVVPIIRRIVRDEPPKAEDLGDVIRPRDLSKTEPMNLEEVAEPPMTEREMMLEDSGVWFDIEAMKANFPATMPADPPRRVQLVRYEIDNCAPCRDQDKEDEALTKSGYTKSSADDSHIRVVKIDADDSQGLAAAANVSEFPTTLVVRDGSEIKRHAGFTKATVLAKSHDDAVHSAPQLTKSVKLPTFAAGEKKITKEQMDLLLNILGENGPIVVPNSVVVINQQGVKFTIPRQMKGTNTVTGNIRRLVFNADSKPFGEFMFLKASADAITINTQTYTLTTELPGILPDTSIKLLTE